MNQLSLDFNFLFRKSLVWLVLNFLTFSTLPQYLLNNLLKRNNVHVIHNNLNPLFMFPKSIRADWLNVLNQFLVLLRSKTLELVSQPHLLVFSYLFLVFIVKATVLLACRWFFWFWRWFQSKVNNILTIVLLIYWHFDYFEPLGFLKFAIGILMDWIGTEGK